jgi:protein TonB
MRAWAVAILAAVVFHGLILLFGGALFMKSEDGDEQTVENVDLLTAAEEEDEPEAEELEPEEAQELEVEKEAPPELLQIAEPMPQVEPTDVVARLDALSLGALEAALDPAASGDGFGGTASLASGGRIGGTGLPGVAGGMSESEADAIFDIGALDQKARVLHQVPPVYPQELRQRKIEGTVYVVFVVDKDGRVLQPTVESSPHEGLQAAALASVRRWRFEPAVARGEKVRSKVRVPIRFSLSG